MINYSEKENHNKAVHAVRITTKEQLEALLLIEKPLSSLMIEKEAAVELKLIAALITKQITSLRSLSLKADGISEQIIFSGADCKELANAIGQCQNIRKLSIENYQSSFRNNIEDILLILPSLPKLKTLSFSHTYLPHHMSLIKKYLAQSKKIESLDLTQCALITDSAFWHLTEGLIENTSLQRLILGDSPIWDHCLTCFSEKLLHNKGGTFRELNWKPLSFYESEMLYLELSGKVNWSNDPEKNRTLAIDQTRLKNYLTTQCHLMKNPFKKACQKLEALQAFLKENQERKPLSSLTIAIAHENVFDINIVVAQIAYHQHYLQELVIHFNNIETENPYFSPEDAALLGKTLKSCPQLHIFKIENFQGSFKQHIALVINAIADLPSLQILGFKKTYLGVPGTESLIKLLAQNNLLELDLTLAGIISEDSFKNLCVALLANQSLQKLSFGRSPMHPSWLKALVMALEKNQKSGLQRVDWQIANCMEMNSKLDAMYQDLINNIFYPKGPNPKVCPPDTLLECEQEDLRKQWEDLQQVLQRNIKANSKQSKPGFFNNEEKGIEMTELSSFNSPIMQPSRNHRNNYGTNPPPAETKGYKF